MASRRHTLLCGLLWSLQPALAVAQATHYSVKLVTDFDHRVLEGEEQVEFLADEGIVEWQKRETVQIKFAEVTEGKVTVGPKVVIAHLRSGGRHTLRLKYAATAGPGIRWLGEGPPREFSRFTGLVTAFYCDAWMACDNTPGQKAALRLEIEIPFNKHGPATGLRAVGPGRLSQERRARDGDHFIFELSEPVQTYLFSFGAARLGKAVDGKFSLYAWQMSLNEAVLTRTKDAYAFFRQKAAVDPMDLQYTQAFLPTLESDFGQEAAGLALMSDDYLHLLAEQDDVYLMAHELAHQWWGVLVGIRSWSDFWLNEGFAEFMADAYIEKHQGRTAYERQMEELRRQMHTLREAGKDRPLHWEKWKDSHEALGQVPYVKGAIFLDELRSELGEENFWRGIALYTSRNARRLVDTRDFQRAMEEASGRDLAKLFNEEVYH